MTPTTCAGYMALRQKLLDKQWTMTRAVSLNRYLEARMVREMDRKVERLRAENLSLYLNPPNAQDIRRKALEDAGARLAKFGGLFRNRLCRDMAISGVLSLAEQPEAEP